MLIRKIDGFTFSITNVYGPTCTSLKEAFFTELRDLGARVEGVWAFLGDFNSLLSVHDKNDPPYHVADMVSFRNVINNLELVDLPIANQAFTWTNGRSAPTLERLDRAFISHDWSIHFPRSTLQALPRPSSDHSPILLTAFTFILAPHLFRMESFWLRHSTFADVISTSWTANLSATSPTTNFEAKFDNVTRALKVWSAGVSTTLRNRADLCLQWIRWLDSAEEIRSLSPQERSLRTRLKIIFEELSLQDEMKWKQRS